MTDRLDELARAHARDNGLTIEKAYCAVLETEEGERLYAEAVQKQGAGTEGPRRGEHARPTRRIMRKLTISELSAVDVPAQTPALAAMMKRDGGADTEELTREGIRRGIDELRRQLAGADPEVAERVLEELCRANARAGEDWRSAFSRLLRENDPLVEAITIAHDSAFRSRASRATASPTHA